MTDTYCSLNNMVFDTNCIACADATGKMVYKKISRRTVGPADVHIEITYSGVCHSDIHTGKGEWGDVSKAYPLCVGHEILGTVKAVGASVTKFKVCVCGCLNPGACGCVCMCLSACVCVGLCACLCKHVCVCVSEHDEGAESRIRCR